MQFLRKRYPKEVEDYYASMKKQMVAICYLMDLILLLSRPMVRSVNVYGRWAVSMAQQ